MKQKKKNNKPNPNKNPFKFCKVCNLNHDQGRRHIYYPNHIKALSSYLSNFQNKLSDILFFLKNPSLLRPEDASRNRFWCVFCDADVRELDSLMACGNAINHLSSSEHLKNLRDFLWKHGGGTDRIDSFRVSVADLTRWENSCRSLKSAAPSSSKTYYGPLFEPSKDIHHELSTENMDSFEKNSIHSFKSSLSNDVLPLQRFTNERYQVSHPDVSKFTFGGHASLPLVTYRNMELQSMHSTKSSGKHLTVHMDSEQAVIDKSRKASVSPSNGWVLQTQRMVNGEDNAQGNSSLGIQNLTRISVLSEDRKANVHTGAPPPWLATNEENDIKLGASKGLCMNNLSSPSEKSGKSRKLNPKRVGAAWAEKRRMKLEMEKRGEIVSNNCDADWLPNFGRVWQAGTRKESRKEFEMEKQKLLKVDNLSETSIKIQPYISKRMRLNPGESEDAAEFGATMNNTL